MIGKNNMTKDAPKQKKQIVVQSEIIKVEYGTVLYFKIDYVEKTVALWQPKEEYYDPLKKNIKLEHHEMFVKAYKKGLEFAKKRLKDVGHVTFLISQ